MKKNTTFKKLTALFAAACMLLLALGLTASAASTISRSGTKKRTVTKGSEFELSVVKNGYVKDNDLKWSIKNKSIVAFDDTDHYDDDMEFRALKAGTTTITCKNINTKEKVTYKITVKKPKKSSSGSIQARNSVDRTVNTGREFELKVKRSQGTRENDLKWTVADTSIVDFEDYDDIYEGDDEMEFVALSTGKTTITCTNTATNEKVSFTITVI